MDEINILSSTPRVRLRAATIADRETIFHWRNDPWIVSLSLGQRTVAWAEHVAWFESVIDDLRHLLLLIEDVQGVGMGSVRFDFEEETIAVVTVYLLRQFTGRGYGVGALKDGSALAFARWPRLEEIRAHIRSDNRASVSAFAKAGFQSLRCDPDSIVEHVVMVKYRTDISVS